MCGLSPHPDDSLNYFLILFFYGKYATEVLTLTDVSVPIPKLLHYVPVNPRYSSHCIHPPLQLVSVLLNTKEVREEERLS